MKIAILMRHAEAARHADDYERDLTQAGRVAAKHSATRIAARTPNIDWAITSAAVRAHNTAELVLSAMGSTAPLTSQEALYEAGTETYLEELRRTPENVSCVLLVGHNPTVSALAQRLSGLNVSLGTAEWVAIESEATDWKRFGRA
jgi:phosphohistidine phosphatase